MVDLIIETVVQANWLFVGLVMLGGFILAHIVGYSFAQSLEVEPGHGREVMPSLPVAPMKKGRAAVRFHKSVLRVEGLLLKEFQDGARGADATTLGGTLNEDPIIVSAALERMREEIPCRMGITATGRILHDFAAEDIAALRRKRRAWLPVRLLVFGLAGLANVGAIWPVLLILMLAFWTLDVAISNATDTAVQLGAIGLGAIVVAFVAAMGVSWLMHLLLTPLLSAPKLGGSNEDLTAPQRRSENSNADTGWWAWFGSSSSRRRRRSGGVWWFGGSSSSRSSSRSSSSSSSDVDGGGGAAIVQVIIIVIAVAIIVLCTIALFVWCRGLWRAVSADERELERVSPAFWVRTAVPVDVFERFIPTNDLVGRVYRALSRAHSHRRPVDEDLGPRVLMLASNRERRVSTIDIALAEGLDLAEAAEVGSRLSSLVGGSVLVSDEGDLVFEFPSTVLLEVKATVDENMWAEFLDPDPDVHNIRRRVQQQRTKLPVNLVGLTHSHIVATDRLVGGTVLMAISGMLLLSHPGLLSFHIFAPLTDILRWLSHAAIPITVALFGFAVAAMALSAAARYTARAVAIHGVQRDLRRATFDVIRGALDAGDERAFLTDLARKLQSTFGPAWQEISRNDVEKEITGVLIDLDLSPYRDERERLVVDLDRLRQRRDTARTSAEAVFGDAMLDTDDDPVIFETEISHDRVKLLA